VTVNETLLNALSIVRVTCPRLAMKLSFLPALNARGVFLCALLGAALTFLGCASFTRKPAGPYGEVDPEIDTAPIGLHRVVVQVIDGKNVPATGNVPVTSSVFVVGPGFVVKGAQFQYWLTPGEHTLKFAAVVNSRDTTTWLRPQVNFSPPDAGVLKLNVEAGKRYWIAAQVNPARPEIWQAVVYKTDDIPRYRPG
jgi:hypothetical protein